MKHCVVALNVDVAISFDWLLSRVFPQELERRLALQEQDFAIVKNIKSEVARVPDLERDLKRLREDNAFLRSKMFLMFQWTCICFLKTTA